MANFKKLAVSLIILIFVGFIIIFFYFGWQRKLLSSPFISLPASIQLADSLRQQGFSLSSPPVSSGDTLIASISGVTCYFSATKDLALQARALQLVLGRLKIKDKPKEIDLRFSKVILRY